MSYKNEYYEQVDSLFDQMKRNPFSGPLSDPTAYERDIPVEPASWVENSQATVIIDDDGITITDGKLSVTDASGTVVISSGVVQADGIAARAIRIGHLSDDIENLVSNSSMEEAGGEIDARGWEVLTGTVSDFNRGAFNPHSGSNKMRIKHTSDASTSKRFISEQLVRVQPGSRYRISAWMSGSGSNSIPADARLVVEQYDSAGAFVMSTVGGKQEVPSNTTYAQYSRILTLDSTTHYVRVGVGLQPVGALDDEINVDDIEFYRVDADISHAAGDVDIDSAGITVTNGKITVTNAGSTVVIDGTSNMFKILATGTLSNPTSGTRADNTSGTVSSTLSGLGTFSTTPAHLSGIGFTTGSGDARYIGQSLSMTGKWVAASSGGAVTTRGLVAVVNADFYTTLNGSSECVINLYHERWGSGGAEAAHARYYVLKESAI